MNFDNPQMVESISYDLMLADWPRSLQRARINDIANGKPPYTEEEVEQNQIPVNINDLTHTRSMHDARAQFYSAFLKPPHFFLPKIDIGPRHKRQEWNTVAASKAARVMKRSLPYFEAMRSRFALLVLHGIGPSAWEDRDKWCSDPMGIDDVLIPSNTLLTMKNLPFYLTRGSLTAPELIRQTTGPKVDPGWNLDLVQSCLVWMDSQMMTLRNNNWPEFWSPEKQGERIKAGAWYCGDQAPRIDYFNFYFWSDEGRRTGWRRRMILDPWSTPIASGAGWTMSRRSDGIYNKPRNKKGEDVGGFLFNPGNRVYAKKLSDLITFQFADLSAVSPFHTDTVRSLGWVLHAVCHMQNRMRCAVNKHILENLNPLFQCKSEEDFQRALKVQLINYGFLDESIRLVPAAERYQIQAALAELGLNENRQLISDSTSNWAQQKNYSSDRTEKTKFQVMAEVSAASSMVSAALLQAYAYQDFEDQTIWARMLKKDSRDPDCREVRTALLKAGIPEEYLKPECWDVEHERVMGAGNKTMEMAIAEWLMQNRMAYDSQAQQEILRDVTLLVTDDATRTRAYVPEGPRAISNSQHDAQLSLSGILMGNKIDPVEGQDHKQVIAVWMTRLGEMIAQAEKRGGMASPHELMGMKNLSTHIEAQIAMVERDPEEKEQVKQWRDIMARSDNLIKAYEQRLVQAMQKQQQANGQGGLDPKDAAKIQGKMLMDRVNAQSRAESHAQRTAQRDVQFQQQLQHDRQKMALEVQGAAAQRQLEQHALDLKTAGEIKRNRMKSFSE